MEFDEDAPLAQSFKAFKRNNKRAPNMQHPEDPPPPPHAQLPPADEHSTADAPPEILVSQFDHSVDNHFKTLDTVSTLCGCAETLDVEEGEIKRLSNSIIFLRYPSNSTFLFFGFLVIS